MITTPYFSIVAKTFISTILCLFVNSSSLQGQVGDWLVTPPPIMPYQVMDSFPDEEAVILLKKGNITTGYDGMFVTSFVRMIILKESALDEANIKIPFYAKGGAQNVQFPRGRTWNWDGKSFQETSINRKDVHQEKIDDEVSMISFVLPQVKVGSIIDFQYDMRKKSPISYNWVFQGEYPTIRNELKFHPHGQMVYRKVFQNGLNLDLLSDNSDKNHWYLENIPAAKEEAFIDNVRDYAPKMMLQLAAYSNMGQIETLLLDWEGFTKDIYERKLLGRYAKKNKSYDGIVRQLCTSASDNPDKIKRIYDYVQSEISWNGELEAFTENKINEIHRAQKGSSCEINLFLTHMIRAAGIEAYPMLLSTRDHGLPIEDFPLMRQFNTIVCYAIVDGKPMVLDAKDPLLPYTQFPEENLNRMGFVIEKENGRWEAIPQAAHTSHAIMTQLELNEEGVLTGSLRERTEGYLAHDYRIALQASSKEEFVNAYQAENLPQGEILDFLIEDLDTVEQPLIVSMNINSPDFCQQVGEYLYLSPLLMMKWEENPFSQSERIYPIDLRYPVTNSGFMMIQLPDGYQIESVPKNTSMRLPSNEMIFQYAVQHMEAQNMIQVQYQFRINQTLYPPEEYEQLKLMYDAVMARHGEQIVLRKQ